jgi:hypothetical protein
MNHGQYWLIIPPETLCKTPSLPAIGKQHPAL